MSTGRHTITKPSGALYILLPRQDIEHSTMYPRRRTAVTHMHPIETQAAAVRKTRRIDLTGQTFGFWTVIKFSRCDVNASYWQCVCNCGKMQSVNSNLLRTGKSRGCRQCSGRWKHIDLTGKTFWSMTVLERAPTRGNQSYFRCRCVCGAERLISANNLQRGQAKACRGCSNGGDKNSARIAAVKLNGGNPILYGTREYRTAASCKTRAKSRGQEFGFSTLSACALWIKENTPATCPVLGTPLKPSKGFRSGFKRDMPSVDRRDSTRGYTPDNMMIMSMQANAMKNNASPEELRAFARWVIRTYGLE